MRIKALLLIYLIASAPSFLSSVKLETVIAQEEVPPNVVPSPLQPAATLSAKELRRVEDLGGIIEVVQTPSEGTQQISFKTKIFGYQILGVKIAPLILALIAMAVLSVVLTRLTVSFPIMQLSDKNLKDETIKLAQEKKKEPTVKRKKRGRPPKKTKKKTTKKRPRGRPRKTSTS